MCCEKCAGLIRDDYSGEFNKKPVYDCGGDWDKLDETDGRICGEFVMCYPPGIPILAPGEKITKDILDYIKFAKEKGCNLTGCRDMKVERLEVVK